MLSIFWALSEEETLGLPKTLCLLEITDTFLSVQHVYKPLSPKISHLSILSAFSPLSFPNQPLSDLNWLFSTFSHLLFHRLQQASLSGIQEVSVEPILQQPTNHQTQRPFSILILLGSIWHPTTFSQELGPFLAP